MSSRARIATSVAIAVVVVAAMLATAQVFKLTATPSTEGADRVVVFGIPRLGLDDLGSGDVPTVDRLVRDGAMASMSVRTSGPRPDSVEAYASLSAGTRVRANGTAAKAYEADAPLEGSTAAQVTELRGGVAPTGEIVLPGGPSAIDDAGADVSSFPGALGTALGDDGRRTAVVGNADEVTSKGELVIRRPAAIAAMRDDGSVDTGAVGTELLAKDPAAPFGLAADPKAFVAEAEAAIEQADFVVLDPGDTDRAWFYGHLSTPAQVEQLRREALRATDAILATVVDALPPGTMLVVAGMTPPTSAWELTPVVFHGAGVPPGHLQSESTKRPDLVTLSDISASALHTLGVPAPDGMSGQPLEYREGDVSVARLQRANDVATGRERIYYPMSLTFIIVQALFYLVLIIGLGLGLAISPKRAFPWLRLTVLTFAAWPLATYLVRLWPWLMTLGWVAHLLVWLVAGAIALGASRVRGHPLAPLGVITAVTSLLLLVDVATGARLQVASILGYSPHTSARYFGFGNTAYAVLAATSLITATLYVDRARNRHEALIVAGLFLGVVVIADGAPWLGSDVGGILSLVPVFAITMVVLSGRRVSRRVVGIALGSTILVLCLAVGADLLRPEESRTHLANFVLDSRDGDTFWTTVSRKWSTNQRVLKQSAWTWWVPLIAIVGGYVIAATNWGKRLLPVGSPLRAGALGVLAAGVLGWLVNDSGIVVTALALVYLGPFLTLLVLAERSSRQEATA